MSLRIMQRVTFCAGHRLLGHDGRCKNLHGHNYIAEFHFSAPRQDAFDQAIDFALLKDRCKGWIDRHWDHAFLLWEQDTNALGAVRSCEPHRVFELPYNPTAENMARYLLEEVAPQILGDMGLTLSKVAVWESEQSFAEATSGSH